MPTFPQAQSSDNSIADNMVRYTDYQQDHDYQYDSGAVVMPTAGRTAGHRRIRLHGGLGMRVVKWKAARFGQPPVAPTHDDTLNDTLLSSSVHAALPIPQPQSGTYVFSMWGEYTYVQNEPRIVGTNTLPTGIHPYPVEPMDMMYRQLAGNAAEGFEPLTDLDNYDSMVEAVQAKIIRPGAYSWPLTLYPAYFTTHTIAG